MTDRPADVLMHELASDFLNVNTARMEYFKITNMHSPSNYTHRTRPNY